MKLSSAIQRLVMPENLAVNTTIKQHRERLVQGLEKNDIAHFALGQSPFPVPAPIVEALKHAAAEGAYASAVGSDALTEAIIDFNHRHFKLRLAPDQIFISNGTKMLMYMLFSVLDGHYILPVPAWVGYHPLLDYLHKPYTRLRLQAEDNYKLNLQALETLLQAHDHPILILNHPHNPTGAVYTRNELEAIATLCETYEAVVIADEIYGLVTYDHDRFHSMASFYPQRTFVTQGLSKDRSAAGYRFGVCVLPTENTPTIKAHLAALASTLYTNVATPIQQAAIAAYRSHPEIEETMTLTRLLHQKISAAMVRRIRALGFECSQPEGAFYSVIDFNSLKHFLSPLGLASARALTEHLLHDPVRIALVMGESIGCADDDLLARLAFVDYDGAALLEAFKESKALDTDPSDAWLQRWMPRMTEGLDRLALWLLDLTKAAGLKR